MATATPIFEAAVEAGRLYQCQILSGVGQHVVSFVGDISAVGKIEASVKTHPFAIILTQDCDLAQDFTGRASVDPGSKKLTIPNVLLCEMDVGDRMRSAIPANSEVWRRIVRNNEERFHYLRAIPAEADLLGEGTDELVMDFRRVFTIPTDQLYLQVGKMARSRAKLSPPYLEHCSSRFANFLSRVALPIDHHVPLESITTSPA